MTAQVREAYERAIANVPPAPEKRFWQRYIYLWINYALYEELEARDDARTREVYRACLQLIPHKLFTFAKVGSIALHARPARLGVLQGVGITTMCSGAGLSSSQAVLPSNAGQILICSSFACDIPGRVRHDHHGALHALLPSCNYRSPHLLPCAVRSLI